MILLVPLIVFCGKNFSVDSYGILLDSSEHINAFIGSARWFGALVYKVYSLSGHNPILNCTIDILIFILLISIVSTALAVSITKLISGKEVFTYLIIDLCVLISVINVWSCNVLAFSECIYFFGIGYTFCYIAIIIYIRLDGFWKYIISGLFLICATGIYQQFISVFCVYIIIICGIEVVKTNNLSLKSILLYYIKPALLILISGIVYFLIAKIVLFYSEIEQNSRIALSISSIIDNLIYFISNQHSYLKGRGFFTTEILTICYLLVGGIWLVVVINDWRKNKQSMKIVFIGISFTIAYAATYVPGILSTSHAARAMFAVFSTFALFSIGTLSLTNNKYIKYVIVSALSVVLILNIYKINICEIDLKEQNNIDKVWCEQVIDEIELYELENNIEVNEILFSYDKNFDMSVSGVSYSESAVLAGYSIEAMINYYSNREFEVSSMPSQKHTEYFDENDWTSFSKEQLVFDGDTLYICCY